MRKWLAEKFDPIGYKANVDITKELDDTNSVLDKMGIPLDFLKAWDEAAIPNVDVGLPNAMQLTSNMQMPLYPYILVELYNTVKQCPVFITIINNLTTEIFKHGIKLKPRFVKICMGCDEEYDYDVESCESCGASTRPPLEEEKEKGEKFINSAGVNGEPLEDILKFFEMDLNIIDDAYMLLKKKYINRPNHNEVLGSLVKSATRIFPQQIRIVSQDRGKIGGVFQTCRRHRDVVHTISNVQSEFGDIREHVTVVDNPVCPKCEALKQPSSLEDVKYVGLEHGIPKLFYIEGEVLHASKYFPSESYGYPPALILWRYTMTLIMMDKYILEYYTKGHPPSGVVAISTRNQGALVAWWKKIWNQRELNPHYPPVIGIDSETGSGGASYIPFSNNLEEMQYIAMRDEIRQRMSSFFGVSNIFMGDASASGGLNNETQQILVTDRAMEKGRQVYTKKIFPELTKSLNLTEWEIGFGIGEITDLDARTQLDIQRANHAQLMQILQYKPILQEDGSFKFIEQEEGEMGFGEEEEFDLFGEMGQEEGEEEQGAFQMATDEFRESWKDIVRKLLSDEKTIYKLYAGLSKSKIGKLMKILEEEFSKMKISPSSIQKRLHDEIALPWHRAEVITRTEYQAVTQKAREVNWQTRYPDDEYYWSVTHDHRTSDVCKGIETIVNQEGGSVSLDRLRKIVKNTSTSKMGPYWTVRDWVPHPNCRSKLVRKVV